ncbi:P-loop containing nucleoside triphosphate hydrolase protein [Neolentinus lepideus HHB14362 ss-1]|uniref:p-loop containing nucleoside triphosphate hydrolase protein n=1 Tax=Neolentinus lepideus HHB14362 ss-1 TaxID=1314782 RepID=A0A165QHY5_9AGAM|nr:P-loop containing nucleoside triphosphate hydrolase protein [Neolentinus lepideus HHB14362 ss-1]
MSLTLQATRSYLKSGSRLAHTSALSKEPLVHIPKCNVYRFDDTKSASPIFRDLQWNVHDGENWAVVGAGSGEKTMLLEVLDGNYRLRPPPHGGIFPFLSSHSSHRAVSLVSFAHRPRSSGGQFYDYTARYGSVWEEDKITLRQSMFPETLPEFARRDNVHSVEMSEEDRRLFDELVEKLDLGRLLDLPLIALSNGQTRKARILKALLVRPELMLLDEPLTGVDATTRPLLLTILQSLHAARNPRIILGLRKQDPVPEWITHVAAVMGGTVATGEKGDILRKFSDKLDGKFWHSKTNSQKSVTVPREQRDVLVHMKCVNVKYHERHVLKDINWKIHAGDRWHLQGANGSGKTTLLSILTGDHPQSYNQPSPHSELKLFGRRRSQHATSFLATRVGIVSPEIYNAFPRRRAMTVWEAVGTGFDGTFVPHGKHRVGLGLQGGLTEEEEQWRVNRVKEVIRKLGPSAWGETVSGEQFGSRNFADLSAGEQGLVLLMRALVGRPPLVILDEVWSGMDGDMIENARQYLRNGGVGDDQAVVVVTHWEEEVPWTRGEGIESVRQFRLQEGSGVEMP